MKINPLTRESSVLKAQWHSYATLLSFGVKSLPLKGEGSGLNISGHQRSFLYYLT